MNIAGIAALRFVDMETALNASRVLTVTAATVRRNTPSNADTSKSRSQILWGVGKLASAV